MQAGILDPCKAQLVLSNASQKVPSSFRAQRANAKNLEASSRRLEQPRKDIPEIGWAQNRSRGQLPGSDSMFHSAEPFESLGTSPSMTAALEATGIYRPSIIQCASLKAFADHGGHVLLADHAGSGKTLAYLIPILEYLRKGELDSGLRYASSHAPAVIIVAPTQELCSQVRAVAKDLSSQGMPFSIKLMTGGARGKLSTQREALQGGPDIVIGTPGRISDLVRTKALMMTCCQALVLDEVDVLLGEASMYQEQVSPLLESLPEASRIVLVTASLPSRTWLELQNRFEGLKPVLGPGLHRVAPGSREQLIDCSGGEEKNEDTAFKRKASAMLQAINQQPTAQTVVFCNKIETCRKVENFLKRSLEGASVLPFHAAVAEKLQRKNLQTFSMRTPERSILVSTDRLSRGINTEMVEHVILFDFPRDASEYLRRAGRTARGARGKGTVSILVLGRQVMLAKKILERNEAGQPLHVIPSLVQ